MYRRVGSFSVWALVAACLMSVSCYQGMEDARLVRIVDTPEEIPAFTLNVDAAEGGAVSVSPRAETYAAGTLVRVSAVPEAGWHFAGWQGTKTASANPLVFSVTGDEWIIPSFARDDAPETEETYTLRVDSAPNGSVAIDPVRERYASGEYVKVTALPGPGYLFDGWTGTVASGQNPLVIRVTESVWLIPTFRAEETFGIVTDRNPVGGTVLLNPDRTEGYRYGELCTLTAVPGRGYRFDGWSGDFTGTEANLFLSLTRDYQVRASFSAIPTETAYALTIDAPAHGSIVANPDKATYYENEIVRLTAIPDPGYMLGSWSGNADPGAAESFDLAMDGDKSVSASFVRRGWTHLVYMAADNNLDSQALNDLNEMEAALTEGKAMSILALVDRAAGNGDWSDTRLYEIVQDPSGNSALLTSRRLGSTELGLSADGAGELNLSDPVNLRRFLSFARRAYAAEEYSLTIWGHGTGWRGGSYLAGDAVAPMKAVAVDATSGTYMTVAGLGDALSGENLSVIGFDTCFGALLEVAYELRDCGSALVASEGPVRETGWDYASLYSAVDGGSAAGALTAAMVDQFGASYGSVGNATISAVDLSAVAPLLSAFNAWSSSLAAIISTAPEQAAVRAALFDSSSIDAFYLADTASDYYADVASLVSMALALTGAGTLAGPEAAALNSRSSALLASLGAAVTRCWSAEYGGGRKQLGVFVIGVNGDKVPLASHGPSYVRGSGVDTGDFVKACDGWVPSVDPSDASFLNRVFYTVF